MMHVHSDMEPVVELLRAGESLEFKVGEISPNTVANAFRLEPQTVWLKQEFGRRCYFPDRNGMFNFDADVGDTVFALTVEGVPIQSVPCATPATTPSSSNQPYYKPTWGRKDATFNVKVVKASMSKLSNGKVEFERLEQTHISLDEHTANVNTVTNAVQLKWGSEYVVVTGDGLEVDDSSGTQGKFWRAPTRKFYAIKRDQGKGALGKGKKREKKERIILDSSSDSDDFLPQVKLSKKKHRHERELASVLSTIRDEIHALHQNMQSIEDEIHAVHQDMRYVREIDRRMKVPSALYRQLSDTFKCSICRQTPINPPVIFGRCCKSIIGCQTCVDTWYRGDDGINKQCPLCGTDRALPETMRLHRLDDFLLAIEPLLSEPQDIQEGSNTSE